MLQPVQQGPTCLICGAGSHDFIFLFGAKGWESIFFCSVSFMFVLSPVSFYLPKVEYHCFEYHHGYSRSEVVCVDTFWPLVIAIMVHKVLEMKYKLCPQV